MENTKTGVELIAEERLKQIHKHGFTGEHHAEHPEWYAENQLQTAVYLLLLKEVEGMTLNDYPKNWDPIWFQKLMNKDHRDRLIISGALISAELDRRKAIEKQNNTSPLEMLKSINEKLSMFLSDEDLTDEKLRDASESLLPNIQSECAKILLQNT